LNAIAIPDALNTPVIYPIAMARGDNAAGGQAFVKFILSGPGQDIVAQQDFEKAGR
jgi:ABC-type molybdate transport system substrate-binding protein